MTPEALRRAGEALFGRQWQSQLAEDLGVSDRTMRRWAAGTHAVPDGVAMDIAGIASKRSFEIGRLWHELVSPAFASPPILEKEG